MYKFESVIGDGGIHGNIHLELFSKDGSVILHCFNYEVDATNVDIHFRLSKDDVDQLQIALSDFRNKIR